MANKNKKNPHRLTTADIALAILAALGGAIAFMTIALVAGSLLFPESWERQTAEEPSARPSYHGTLPSKAPTSTPAPSHTEPLEESSSEPTPEETEEPVQQTSAPTGSPSRAPQNPTATATQAPASTNTQAPPAQTNAPAPAQTRTPTTQNPGPMVSINPVAPPAQQTRSPAQSGSQGGNQATNSGGFSNGRVLATTESNNNNDPVYHTTNCRSAQRIPTQNQYWYESAQAAEADGRRLCGNCDRSR